MLNKGLSPALMLASVLALTACGGGGGNGADVSYDANEVTQALADKVGVNGVAAEVIQGTPPDPSGSDSLRTDAPDAVPDADAGAKVTVPVTVSADATLERLFAKVPGADSFFQVDLPAPDGKAARATITRNIGTRFAGLSRTATAAGAKADSVLDFEITLPGGLESGRLCFEFSVRDADGTVSNTAITCLNIRQPASEPPPTGGDTAAACLNPEVFAVGTTVASTFEETSPLGTTTVEESYTVTRQTTFNGEPAVELAYDGGFFDYLRVDAANDRVLSIGSQDSFETCTYEPPLEFSFALSPGQSRTQTTTQACSGESFDAEVTTTYVGRERITVPAGSFDTCRIRQAFSAQGFAFSIDTWISVGSGIEIQIDSDGFGGEFSEVLVNASINGQPVTGN